MNFFRDFRRYQGRRIVTCPETNEGAAVRVNALHAASAGELRLSACSRWPERAGCAELCVEQIAASPEACLLQSIVSSWYAGKSCVLCHRAIGTIVWHEAPPALLRRDGTSAEWTDVAAQDLPKTFATSEPLCWQCNNVLQFERLCPELITRRAQIAEHHAVLPPSKSVY